MPNLILIYLLFLIIDFANESSTCTVHKYLNSDSARWPLYPFSAFRGFIIVGWVSSAECGCQVHISHVTDIPTSSCLVLQKNFQISQSVMYVCAYVPLYITQIIYDLQYIEATYYFVRAKPSRGPLGLMVCA